MTNDKTGKLANAMTNLVKKEGLSNSFFNSLPSPFNELSNIRNLQERTVKFLSAIAAFSAALPNYFFKSRGNKYYTHINVLFKGVSGSGKGDMLMAEYLLRDIDNLLRERGVEAKRAFLRDRDSAKTDSERGDIPEPFKQELCFAASTTTAALVDGLKNSPHGLILICPELVTFMNSALGTHGDSMNELFRCSFHHELFRHFLKTDGYRGVVLSPKIASLMSGTPDQVRDFFKKTYAIERGGAGRWWYYNLKGKYEDHSLIGKDVCVFTEKAKDVINDVYTAFSEAINPVMFEMTNAQKISFSKIVNKNKQALYRENVKYGSIIDRFALIFERYLAIITAVKQYRPEKDPLKLGRDISGRPVLTPETSDVLGMEELYDFLLWQTVQILEENGMNSGVEKRKTHLEVLAKYHTTFQHKDMVKAIVDHCGKHPSSAKGNIKTWVKRNLVRINTDGTYTKIKKNT